MPAYDAGRFDPPAPLAFVRLRHSETDVTLADVPMLVDSGADVTLIPQASVLRLGATIDLENGYDLMGFDGSRTVAPSVQVHLLFLRRAFKGRFLVIDQEWGILGRNILNHVAVVLDGPRLNWEEQVKAGPCGSFPRGAGVGRRRSSVTWQEWDRTDGVLNERSRPPHYA